MTAEHEIHGRVGSTAPDPDGASAGGPSNRDWRTDPRPADERVFSDPHVGAPGQRFGDRPGDTARREDRSGPGRPGDSMRRDDQGDSAHRDPRAAAEHLGDRAGELGERATSAARRVAEAGAQSAAERLDGAADAIREAAETLEKDGQSLESDLARFAADSFKGISERLRGQDLAGIMRSATEVAHERPGVFLGGAVLAGFALTRFLKSSAADRHGSGSDTRPSRPDQYGSSFDVRSGR